VIGLVHSKGPDCTHTNIKILIWRLQEMSNPTAKVKIILGSIAIAAMTATATLPSALASCAPKKVCNPCAAKKKN
jgi:hypothetical protein